MCLPAAGADFPFCFLIPFSCTINRILGERSKRIAEQLTVIEASYHLQLTPEQLIEGEDDPHIRRMTTWWNKVCGWVVTVILQQPTPKAQARLIRKFVNISLRLIDLRNYSTASQINSALQHTTIDRLRGYKEVGSFPSP